MVTTNIKSTEYKDGKRIDIVEHTYTSTYSVIWS